MKINDLCVEQQGFIKSLKHASLTVGNEVCDALEDAQDDEEFRQLVLEKMTYLKNEAENLVNRTANLFGKKNDVSIHFF
jgi:hypothetical protein